MQSILRLSLFGLLALFAIAAMLLTRWLEAGEVDEAGSSAGANTFRGIIKLGPMKLQIAMDASPGPHGGFRATIIEQLRGSLKQSGSDA